MINRSISESSPARSSSAPLLSAFPLRSSVHSAPLRYLFFSHCLSPLPGDSSFFSRPSSPNCQMSAINAKSASILLRLSIILINKCRRADIFRRSNLLSRSSQTLCPLCSYLGDLCVTVPLSSPLSANCKLSAVDFELSFSPKSNHSRTSANFARKSNHSRTYPKTGGWGAFFKMPMPITLLFSYTMLTAWLTELSARRHSRFSATDPPPGHTPSNLTVALGWRVGHTGLPAVLQRLPEVRTRGPSLWIHKDP